MHALTLAWGPACMQENIVRLDSVHLTRAEPATLWLAFDIAKHDLYEV